MQPNIMKSAMQNGLIMGVIFSINFILSITNITALVMLTYFIAIGIVFLTYKMAVRFRDTECEGVISYGKAFSYILYIFFYAALISTVVKYIYFQFINPGYLETMFQETMKMVKAMKMPMDSAGIEQTENMFKPVSFIMLYIWMNVIMGTLIGLIMSAFVKKNKSLFEK